MVRSLLAEALGTAFLLLSVVGSAIMAANLMPDAPGQQLLANAGATGLALYVLITIFGPVSGAHFNPAVTLAFLIEGETKGKVASLYILTQVIAAIFGVLLAHYIFADLPIELSSKSRQGSSQYVSEIVATFGLVLLILLARKSRAEAIPALVGTYIAGAYWFTSSTSFANPAVTFGRIFTDSPAGIAPDDVLGFVVMQLIGAGLAIVAARILNADKPAQ